MGGDVLIDSETFLVIDFMNLKIKLTQPFRDPHRDRVYVCIHRSACSYISICVFTVFLKKLNIWCISKHRSAAVISEGGRA
jgi:hypothetical protein